MEKHSTVPYKGYNINIYYDNDAESPRTFCEPLGTMYTAHRRYCPEEQFDAHFNINEVFDGKLGNFRDSFLKQYIALPIYLYDHGGLAVSTSSFCDSWDSGFFGIIAISLQKVREEYGWKVITQERRKKIESYLQGEIDTYNEWLHGEVYGFDISVDEDKDEDGVLPEIDESCWGFYGDDGIEEIIREAKASIDCEVEALARRQLQEQKCEMICEAFGVD